MKNSRIDEEFYLDEFGNAYLMRGVHQQPALPTDLDAYITLNPHYSNPKFDRKGEVEIWGRKTPGMVDYVYSDRLHQWSREKSEAGFNAVKEAGLKPTTARWVQVFLSGYFDRPVEVCHIYAGVFTHSGYSYWVAGYKWAEVK